MQYAESRETLAFEQLKLKDSDIEDKIKEINKIQSQHDSKQFEMNELNKQMLKLQDDKLDYEGRLENIDSKEHELKEEIVKLQDVINGKDQAIKQISETMKIVSKEKDRLSEMVSYFKNKLIVENCFHQVFAAQKIGGQSIQKIKSGSELTIGFVRDQNDEDEFFLEMITKGRNKSGEQETVRIAVDDIDEIEHVQGSLQFYIHYQCRKQEEEQGAIGFKTLLNKIKSSNEKSSKNHVKEERTEQFESKFVK